MENEFVQAADTHGNQIDRSLDQSELCHATTCLMTYSHLFIEHLAMLTFFTWDINDRCCNMYTF